MDECSDRGGCACTGKASAKDGRSLQMEEGLWMQHELERLGSGLQHLLAKRKAIQLIIRTFVATETNAENAEAPGKRQGEVWTTSIAHCH